MNSKPLANIVRLSLPFIEEIERNDKTNGEELTLGERFLLQARTVSTLVRYLR